MFPKAYTLSNIKTWDHLLKKDKISYIGITADIIVAYLTLYHTIPTFNNPDKEAFWKDCGKQRKCW